MRGSMTRKSRDRFAHTAELVAASSFITRGKLVSIEGDPEVNQQGKSLPKGAASYQFSHTIGAKRK